LPVSATAYVNDDDEPGCATSAAVECRDKRAANLSELRGAAALCKWDNTAMLLVAQITLGVGLSFLLLRHLPLCIRVSALLLLALVMMFLVLCVWPAFQLVRWMRRPDHWWTREHSPHLTSPALAQPVRRIPHSG
jgi:hypothetical protein